MTMLRWTNLAVCALLLAPGGAGAETVEPPPLEIVWEDGSVEVASVEPAAGPRGRGTLVDRPAVSADVLGSADAAAYRKLLREARAGKAPDSARVKDDVLMGYVRGVYLLAPGHSTSFSEANAWLREHRDLVLAADVYKLAEGKRERPREVCETKKVTRKVKGKDGKTRNVTRNQKSCKTVGNWGPMPVKTKAMEDRERRTAEREAAQKARLAKLSEEGRRVLGQSWRARVKGDFPAALRTLLAPGARAEAGDAAWQGEMVKVASFYHGKRDWRNVLRAAEPASGVKGPDRDEALWLAGFASYRLGEMRNAAQYWDTLVREEKEGGSHHSRAAWWAARAYGELGQQSKVKSLLTAGAKDKVGFYGQLCAAKVGDQPRHNWGVPDVTKAEADRLKAIPAVRRALALAQVGEVDQAQKELRAASDQVPYQLTHAMASVAMAAQMPAIAMYSGRDLLERGEVVPGVLFPLPEQWEPRGGKWTFDRALMTGIMRQESAFQPSIGSWAGAQGLMQIMPATGAYVARMIGRPNPSRADLHDPETNLELAQAYLNYLSNRLDGNLMMVVAAYNGGIGNVRRWIERGVTPNDDPVLWMESIPFDETRLYVEKVFSNYWMYQQRMGKKPWSLQELANGNWPVQRNASATAATAVDGLGG